MRRPPDLLEPLVCLPGVLDCEDGEVGVGRGKEVDGPGDDSCSGESSSGPRFAAGFSCAAPDTDSRLALPNRSNLPTSDLWWLSGVRRGLRLDVSAAASRPEPETSAAIVAHLQRVHASSGTVAEWAASASFLPNSRGMRPVC